MYPEAFAPGSSRSYIRRSVDASANSHHSKRSDVRQISRPVEAGVRIVPLIRSMRDNHEGMPEIIDAFKDGDQYFGVVGIEIGVERRKFRFGVSQAGYLALKRVLQLHPFDSLPGLKHHYYFAQAYWKIEDSSDCGMKVRIEQGKNGKQVDVRVPKDLLANLRWFAELKDFTEAAHLPEVVHSRGGEI